MSRIDLYITFWNSGNNEDIPEWQLSVRSTSLDGGQPATTVTYSIVLVAPGTDRWIEAYQTHTEPLPSGRLMGALLLDSSEILEHVDLNTFDTFIKESEDAAPENPFPNRTSWLTSSPQSIPSVAHRRRSYFERLSLVNSPILDRICHISFSRIRHHGLGARAVDNGARSPARHGRMDCAVPSSCTRI